MTETVDQALSASRSRLALLALALGAFVIGTSELVVVGILDLVADDVNVSISTAGTLVTAYAAGISIGGPLITAATIRFGRRSMLWTALLVYTLGNLVAALSVSFAMLAVARVVTGSVHGFFIGVASAVAASLVPPDKQGQAMSMVFGGIAVSTVVGVPMGTFIGQTLGWQAAFVTIVILGVVALLATLLLVPPVAGQGAPDIRAQAKHALAPKVLFMLAVGFLIMCGQFTAFTYLAPFLQKVTGIDGGPVSLFLLAFGVAAFVGTALGGKAADTAPARAIVVANVGVIVGFVALYLFGSTAALVVLCLIVWGLFGFGLIPSLQLRIISLAGPGGDLAATLGASAVNAGIAIGALVGAWAVSAFSIKAVVVAALIIVAVALPLSFAAQRLRPDADPDAGPAPVQANEPATGSSIEEAGAPIGGPATAGQS